LPALGVLGVLAVSEEVPGRWAIFGATALAFLVSEAIYIPLALPRYLEWYYGGFKSPYVRGGIDID
jgi:hypothetical protein